MTPSIFVADTPSVPNTEPPPGRIQTVIASGAILAIAVHLTWRAFRTDTPFGAIRPADWPLLIALALGGGYLVLGLLGRLVRGQFGSDLLAGISIVTSVLLDEYLAGTLVVLMLSGGEALEGYAIRRASSALAALARRMPSVAHRSRSGAVEDVMLHDVAIADLKFPTNSGQSESGVNSEH